MVIADTIRRSDTRTRVHRAWWVATAAAAAIMAAGAFSTMPGLLVDPLHHDLHWSRSATGIAMWVNMALNGLVAPFAAALMERFGIRRVAVGAIAVIAVGAGLTTIMTAVWQFTLYWGLLIGLGTGTLGNTFAAVVTNRWFVRHRGLATGILTAASVFGQFVFLPVLAWIIDRTQWRVGTLSVGLAAVAVIPLTWLLLRDRPSDARPSPYGGAAPFQVLRRSARTRTFWLLAGTFAICGISTNGIMWTDFVPAAGDHGMAPTAAASMLTIIGVCNVAGTVLSGWLTDRYDPRLLLASYYAFRAVTLFFLPTLLGPAIEPPLVVFVVLFGLLDVATVPPTIALSAIRNTFGTQESSVVFGWALAAHQLGAGLMAFSGGAIRDALGTYTMVWISAGALCLVAAFMALFIQRGR